jgi:hypothetical protein
MDKDRQLQFHVKIAGALNDLFDKESENYLWIEELQKEGALNDFFHCLATRTPQHVYAKITGKEVDPLEFNHLANRLILMDAQDQAKKEKKK